jgi:hypothetical protein
MVFEHLLLLSADMTMQWEVNAKEIAALHMVCSLQE